MPIYHLIEYSNNYSNTSGILREYCRDEPAINIANSNIIDFDVANANIDSLKIKEKIIGETDNGGTKNVEIIVTLKYLSNFWRTHKMPLINCKIKIDLNWFEKCVLVATAVPNQGATFSITDTKLYVPVVTLSAQDNAKLLEHLKSGFKRTIDWDKYQLKKFKKRPNQYFINWRKFWRSK